MKAWYSFGSEHSMNLVLIGTFADASKASSAQRLIQELARVTQSEIGGEAFESGETRSFVEGVKQICMDENLMSLEPSDQEHFLYDYNLKNEGARLVLTTEEASIQGFIKAFLQYGARIEVYSAHTHKGPYGR